ncbi:MAG: porin family protein [Candidatus Margulisiibacteriota bacterium]
MINKFILTAFLIAALFSAAAGPSLAADTYLNMIGGVGAGYYYLYPKDLQIQDFYKGGIFYRAFLGVRAESGFSATGDIGYYSEGNRSPLAPYGTALTIIPITASVAYHFFRESSISPYLGGGIGVYNINESDPDLTYIRATKFGKHIFAGLDLYIDKGTVLNAELRQTFIDPASSNFYYQASFGGLTATVNIAMEWPLSGGRAYEPPAASAVPQAASFSDNEYNAIMNHMDAIDSYYYPRVWDRTIYQPWNTPNYYINIAPPPQPTQQQLDEQKAKAEQDKLDQQKKQQDYINQKLQLRQEKKELVNPAGR